jgi:hypothetical protein
VGVEDEEPYVTCVVTARDPADIFGPRRVPFSVSY